MKNLEIKTIANEEEDNDNNNEPVSPTGRMMQTPKFNVAIIAFMGYNTKIDPNLYKKCVQQTLTKHPRFSSILTTSNGKPCWKRTNDVDIENHIFVPDVDPNMGSPDEFVADFAAKMSETPMDMTKPLWEMYILNVKTSDANAVVLMKIHHSLGDGVSLISLVQACGQRLNSLDSTPVIRPPKEPKRRDGPGAVVLRVFVSIWTLILVIFYTLMDSLGFIATLLFWRDTKTPIKSDGRLPSRRRFVHRIVSFDDVRLIKNAMNMTVNDVVLGVTEAGISRYLNTIYERKKENGRQIVKNRINHLPRNIDLRSTVVFNLRPSPTIEDLGEMMEKEELNGKWGNLVGIVLLPFTIDVQQDPLTYIRRAKSTMDRKKLSIAHKIAFFLVKLTTSLFSVKRGAFITRRIFRNTTFTFSNVMGPKEEISLFGHHLTYIAPSVCGFPQSLIVHYQSYGNKLVISIGANEKLIQNPQQLCDDFVKSLQIIKEAVLRKGGI